MSGVVEKLEESNTTDSTVLEGDYYCVEARGYLLCIKSDLFVMLVFSRGSDWAEGLFTEAFGITEPETDVKNGITVEAGDLIFDVENEGQLFKKGILVRYPEKQLPGTEKTVTAVSPAEGKSISLPVVIRLFSREVNISDIDNIGETSEILISGNEEVDVELVVNGEIIGKGRLKKEDEKLKLRITELMI
ncbi:FliM/FliN family flagellar motor switch protein [Persephonella sp.]